MPGDEAKQRTGVGLACVVCGYDLTGVDENGVCPECGALVARSLHRRLLKYADSTYVTALYRGAVLIQLGICIQLIVLFTSVIVGQSRDYEWGLSAGWTAATLLASVGWWVLSIRDPGSTDDARTRRYVLRTALAMFSASAIAALFPINSARWVIPGQMILRSNVPMLLMWPIWIWAALAHARWLATRIPNQRLVHKVTFLRWLIVPLYPLGWYSCIGVFGALGTTLWLVEELRGGLKELYEYRA